MSWDSLYAFGQSTPLLSMAFIGLTLAVIISETRHRLSGIPGLSPAQATEWMNREDALVVDVSAAADFAKGHLPGSISAPLADLDPTKHKQLAKAQQRPVVLVCRSGQTAHQAAGQLKKAGFARVGVLEGGVAAWRAADLPVTKGR